MSSVWHTFALSGPMLSIQLSGVNVSQISIHWSVGVAIVRVIAKVIVIVIVKVIVIVI